MFRISALLGRKSCQSCQDQKRAEQRTLRDKRSWILILERISAYRDTWGTSASMPVPEYGPMRERSQGHNPTSYVAVVVPFQVHLVRSYSTRFVDRPKQSKAVGKITEEEVGL